MQLENRAVVRSARQSRPQLVCVLADNSGSMRGAKAQAATGGIQTTRGSRHGSLVSRERRFHWSMARDPR